MGQTYRQYTEKIEIKLAQFFEKNNIFKGTNLKLNILISQPTNLFT